MNFEKFSLKTKNRIDPQQDIQTKFDMPYQ